MSDVVEVIVTGPPEFMPRLVETLVAERLIACGQLTPIDSTYRWQSAIEHGPELRAAMHTTRGRVDALMQRVRDLHPFEIPCILLVDVSAGDTDYLAWVEDETRPPSEHPLT